MNEESRCRVLLFEDQAVWFRDLRKTLGKCVELHLSLPPPLDKLHEAVTLEDGNPDVIVVDYRLGAGKLSNGNPPYYGAKTLLAALRDASDDIDDGSIKLDFLKVPLVVLTQYRYFTKQEEKEDAERMREFSDYILYKEDVIESPEIGCSKIKALIKGFNELDAVTPEDRTWKQLVLKLQPPDYEYVADLLMNANPPLSVYSIPQDERSLKKDASVGRLDKGKQKKHQKKPSWSTYDATRWIVHVLLEYSGILYNSLHVATALGISIDSFLKSRKLASMFKPAKYKGVFSGISDYWWAYKLRETAYSKLDRFDLGGPIADTFIEVCEKSKIEVEPSICIYSGELHADTVCYILKGPVLKEHALEYLPGGRPVAMEMAYISRKAYEESDDVNIDRLTTNARKKIEKWYKG